MDEYKMLMIKNDEDDEEPLCYDDAVSSIDWNY